MICRAVRLTLATAYGLLLLVGLGCSAQEVSKPTALPSYSLDKNMLQKEIDAIEPKARALLFSKVGAMSLEGYYQFLVEHVGEQPFMLDGQLVVGLHDKLIEAHASFTAWGQQASSIGELWRKLGLHPQAGRLGLADYQASRSTVDCNEGFNYLADNFGASANSIALAYNRVINAPGEVATASTNGRHIAKNPTGSSDPDVRRRGAVSDLVVTRDSSSSAAYLVLQDRHRDKLYNFIVSGGEGDQGNIGINSQHFLRSCSLDPAHTPALVVGPQQDEHGNHSLQVAFPDPDSNPHPAF